MQSGSNILPASRACRYGAPCAILACWLLAMPATHASGAPSLEIAPQIQEHGEFDAMLEAAFAPPARGSQRTFIVHFTAPADGAARVANWRLELISPAGKTIRQWRGSHALHDGDNRLRIRWRAPKLPAGIYDLRLAAGTRLGATASPIIRQRRPLAIGRPRPVAPAGLESLASLGFDVAYGNLHSQTNHSDGGGDPASCRGAQSPQQAPFGPGDAFRFAHRHGLDFLLTSEHNHMYDQAGPAAARQLFRLGRDNADDFNAAHPGFIALYGLEWGVIDGGGHLNILNSPALLAWERDPNGELFGDVETPKGDYAGLYALMQAHGWIGQFNHPHASQFRINGRPLAFDRNGDQAMALCEVMNTSAFSARLDEGETRHSFFEESCNRLLEAGYHIAFSSNQDNHCANWGASYGNRTGILLPAGAARSPAVLLDAIRARRAFATMDKHASIALTANGRIMGQRFDNSGPLTLALHYENRAGRGIAKVEFMAGVPGRNGAVQALAGASGMQHSFTPAPGPHFFYARVTQDDGRMLWSAPAWITQR